jgi:hypothetical protein
VKACQRLGTTHGTLAAVPFVDFMTGDGNQRRSAWTKVPTDSLATPDDRGGLLITGWVREGYRDLHNHYHRALRLRAEWKARHTMTRILQAEATAAQAQGTADDE